MPLFDGNLKIDKMFIFTSDTTNINDGVEIEVARIGTTPIFPDTVGAPVINGFTINNQDDVPIGGGTKTLTVTGTEGATFSLSVDVGSLDRTDFVIGSGLSEEYIWTFAPQANGDPSEVGTVTLAIAGTSILEEGTPTEYQVSQLAGTPLITPTASLSTSAGSTNQGSTVDYTKGYNGDATTFNLRITATGVSSVVWGGHITNGAGAGGPGTGDLAIPANGILNNIPVVSTTISVTLLARTLESFSGTRQQTVEITFPQTDIYEEVKASRSIPLS